jgi:hypothetical protein
VGLGQLLQDGGVRALPGLALTHGRKTQPVEQDLRQLLRRVHVERPAGELEDPIRDPVEGLLDLTAQAPQERHIDGHAVELHLGQYRDERHLHLLEQGLEVGFLVQAMPEELIELEGDVRVLC